MSAAAIASPKAAKASKPKTAVKKVASHPTYSAMIRKSVSELKDKSGSSKAAILKYMLAHYKLGDNVTKVTFDLLKAFRLFGFTSLILLFPDQLSAPSGPEERRRQGRLEAGQGKRSFRKLQARREEGRRPS